MLILWKALLHLAVGRRDRCKLKISPRLDTALLQLHSVITSSAISRLVNFPWLTATDGSVAENALVQLHKQMEQTEAFFSLWAVDINMNKWRHTVADKLLFCLEVISIHYICLTNDYDMSHCNIKAKTRKKHAKCTCNTISPSLKTAGVYSMELHCHTPGHSSYVTCHEKCHWKA